MKGSTVAIVLLAMLMAASVADAGKITAQLGMRFVCGNGEEFQRWEIMPICRQGEIQGGCRNRNIWKDIFVMGFLLFASLKYLARDRLQLGICSLGVQDQVLGQCRKFAAL